MKVCLIVANTFGDAIDHFAMSTKSLNTFFCMHCKLNVLFVILKKILLMSLTYDNLTSFLNLKRVLKSV